MRPLYALSGTGFLSTCTLVFEIRVLHCAQHCVVTVLHEEDVSCPVGATNPLMSCLWGWQVIEKALKKLKLDAMIIQQGRLSDNKASVNKDDLLSMVRYGAEMVFSGGGGTITDEDIDAIIAKVMHCWSSQTGFYC